MLRNCAGIKCVDSLLFKCTEVAMKLKTLQQNVYEFISINKESSFRTGLAA